MSTIRQSGVWLQPASGAALRVRDVGFSNQMNAGVTWEAFVPSYISGTAYNEDSTFQIVVRGPGGVFTTHALTLDTFEGGRGTQGKFTRLAGRDIVSKALNTKNYNAATLWYTDTWTVLTQIVNAAFPLNINVGATNFKIREFNLQGVELGSHLSRVMRDAALNWRSNAGAMDVWPNNLYVTPASIGVSTVYISKTVERLSLAGKIYQVTLHRSLKQPGLYTFRGDTVGVFVGDIAGGLREPLATLLENSGNLKVGYVATFQGPGGSGLLTGFFPMSSEYVGVNPGPIDGSVPTYSCVYVLIPSGFTGSNYGKFQVTGTPLDPRNGAAEPVGWFDNVAWDVSSPVTFPAGKVRRIEVIDSPLWDKSSTGTALAPYILTELNKGHHTVTHEIDFEPRLALPGWYLGADPDFPAARYDTISWRAGDNGGYAMTAAGWVGL